MEHVIRVIFGLEALQTLVVFTKDISRIFITKGIIGVLRVLVIFCSIYWAVHITYHAINNEIHAVLSLIRANKIDLLARPYTNL
jgi:hypothetical protein